MKIFTKIFFVLCLFLAFVQRAGAIVVEARIDSVRTMVGEQTGYHLSAVVKPGQKVEFPQWKPQQMLAPGVEVVDVPRIDTVDAQDGFIRVTQSLILTAFEDTLYLIPKQTVKVDGKPFETKDLALKVLTVPVDTLHPNQFYGPRDVQDNSFSWTEWAELMWMSLATVLLYVLCWLAFIRLRSRKPLRVRVKVVKRVLPHQKALDNIQKLKEDSAGQGAGSATDEKTYYTKLTDTLRTYMSDRFGFNAMEMTTAEIIARLKEEDDQQKIDELTMLLETADLVKFAKYDAGINENDRNLVSAIDFINTTKRENEPIVEYIKPTVTEQQRQLMHLRLALKWAIGIIIVLATALAAYVFWQLFEMVG